MPSGRLPGPAAQMFDDFQASGEKGIKFNLEDVWKGENRRQGIHYLRAQAVKRGLIVVEDQKGLFLLDPEQV